MRTHSAERGDRDTGEQEVTSPTRPDQGDWHAGRVLQHPQRRGLTIDTVTPTESEIEEWARLAQDAYDTGRRFYGDRYSAAAANYSGFALPVGVYDTLQRTYRAWLTGGWENVDNPLTGGRVASLCNRD